MTDETWQQISDELKLAVGSNNHTTWIAPLRFSELVDGVAAFHVPTTFHGNYVLQNFGDQILQQLRRAGITVQRVTFSQSANASAAPRAAAKPAPARPASASVNPALGEEDDATPSATLDPRFTFDRFVVGKPNEMAHAAARRIAEGGTLGFNPLFLYGGVGLGKTHLMHAIGHELRANQPQLKVVLTSAEQFMYRFITALRDKRMMDFKQLFRSVDVLMVDDIQFLGGKDSTQEEFFHTFNALIDAGKRIIIPPIARRAP